MLKHFPHARKLPRRHLSTFALKKVLLAVLACSWAMILTIGYVAWTGYEVAQAQQREMAENAAMFARLRYEIDRLNELNLYTSQQTLDLAKSIQKIVDSGQGDQREFLALMIPEALRVQITHGVPASATMAMSIYESAYGKSELATNAHNFFGIKAFESVWSGPRVYTMTRDSGVKRMAYFRSYPDVEAAVEGYALFLRSNERYSAAFGHRDGALFVEQVLKAGYCPDKDYLAHIKAIMERHGLRNLDLNEQERQAVSASPTPELSLAATVSGHDS
jgi:flagellum-specific peptidoglycan hydrolase FlgJ